MPWKETSAMDERMKFIAEYLREESTITDLCRGYGISRPTAYKWIERYEEEGPGGWRIDPGLRMIIRMRFAGNRKRRLWISAAST